MGRFFLYLTTRDYFACSQHSFFSAQHLVVSAQQAFSLQQASFSAQHLALSAWQQAATLSLQHSCLQHLFSLLLQQQLIVANATATINNIFFIITFVLGDNRFLLHRVA